MAGTYHIKRVFDKPNNLTVQLALSRLVVLSLFIPISLSLYPYLYLSLYRSLSPASEAIPAEPFFEPFAVICFQLGLKLSHKPYQPIICRIRLTKG